MHLPLSSECSRSAIGPLGRFLGSIGELEVEQQSSTRGIFISVKGTVCMCTHLCDK